MSKAGHVRPEEFNDRYEDAVVELIRTKQAGIPAKVTELPSRPSNVVSIMDALRKSVAAEEAAPSSAGKQHEARRGSGRRAQTKGSLEDEGQG
jgi:DNA end-binding protein Ku